MSIRLGISWKELAPIDMWMLIIELLVLLLIFYEVVAGVCSKVRAQRRIKTTFQCMVRGQNLQAGAPHIGTEAPVAAAWVDSVEG